MKGLSSKIVMICLSLTLIGLVSAQSENYRSWKHELQDLLELEQTGKADKETYEELVVYLQEIEYK